MQQPPQQQQQRGAAQQGGVRLACGPVARVLLLLTAALVAGVCVGSLRPVRMQQQLQLRRRLTEMGWLGGAAGGLWSSGDVAASAAAEELEKAKEKAGVKFYSGKDKTFSFEVCNGFTNQRLAFLSGAPSLQVAAACACASPGCPSKPNLATPHSPQPRHLYILQA